MQEDAGTMQMVQLVQDVSPKCFGAAGAIQHGEVDERKVGGEGFQVLPEISLPNCLGSGFKLMKICKGTLLASAEWMLLYGCSLIVKLSILQQSLRLQAVRNAHLC